MLNLFVQTSTIAASARPLCISYKWTADGTGLPIGTRDWHEGALA